MNIPSLLRRRFVRLSVTALVAGVALYAVAGFFIVPAIIENTLPGALENNLRCKAELGEVKVNPFTLSLEASRFDLRLKDETQVAGFERLYVNFQVSSLFRWAWTFKDFIVHRPHLDLAIEPQGDLNLSRLVANQKDEDREQSGDPARLLLHNIQVHNGTVSFSDLRVNPPAAIALQPIHFHLDNLSTLPERKGPYTLNATTGEGAFMRWTGHIALTPFWSNGTLTFDDVNVASVWAFFKDELNLAPPEGKLHVETAYSLKPFDGRYRFALRNASLDCMDVSLRLSDTVDPFFDFDRFALHNASLDTADKRIALGSITLDRSRIDLSKTQNGRLNVQHILRDTSNGAYQQQRAVSDETEGDDSGGQASAWKLAMDRMAANALAVSIEGKDALNVDSVDLERGSADLADRRLDLARFAVDQANVNIVRNSNGSLNWLLGAPGSSSDSTGTGSARANDSWSMAVQDAVLNDVRAAFTDMTVAPDTPIIEVNDFRAEAANLTTHTPFNFTAEAMVSQGGRLAANGTLDPGEKTVTARLACDRLSLLPLQPYIHQFTFLELNSGTVSTSGRINVGTAQEADLSVAANLSIDDFNLVDTTSGETLLGFAQLATDDLRLKLAPDSLVIAEAMLRSPSGQLIIFEDKSVNVARAFKQSADSSHGNATVEEHDAGDPFPLRLDSLRVSGGSLDFADYSLVLPFRTKIHELEGLVNGLSSTPGKEAKLQLDGRVADYGLATIRGDIDFFDPKRFTDVTVVFENVEMTTLNPYTATFAGRKIESGKLDLDLEYEIKDAALLGDNQIVVDQLTLGEKVDSPDAVGLPLELAVALLKDSKGTIDIDLPVKGDLNNPEFSFGHLIGKAIFSLLSKIVTSPFRILGALIPDMPDEDIDRVIFDPGSAKLPPPQEEKAVKLAEALSQRPDLGLTVTGHVNPESDEPALRDLELRRAIAEDLGRQVHEDQDPGPVDMESFRTQLVLKSLFARRIGALPLKEALADIPQQSQNATLEASQRLYDRLFENQSLESGALSQLAADRADNAVSVLVEQGGLDPGRVRINQSPETEQIDGPPRTTFEVTVEQGVQQPSNDIAQ